MNVLAQLLNRRLREPAAVRLPVRFKRSRYVEELNEARSPGDDELVFVGPKNRPEWVVLNCPCGCGYVLNVDLNRAHEPHWWFFLHFDGTVSVFPVISARDAKCRSHFYIHRGRVIWATTEDDSPRK